MEILCFFAALVYVYLNAWQVFWGVLTLVFLRPRLRFILWFVCGIFWAWLHQWLTLPVINIPNISTVVGYIESIPNITARKTQFQFVTERVNNVPLLLHVSLACYQHCPPFEAGQYWQFQVKLKKPVHYANPGVSDYTKGLQARHISYVGYIRQIRYMAREQANNTYRLLAVREYLACVLSKALHQDQSIGILQALVLGLTPRIDTAEWDLFRRTGTTHLMVISGAHISLVAGMVYGLVKWLWSCGTRLFLLLPAQRAASIIAMLLAAIYALLAGLGVPSQRALIVCMFMFYQYFCHQRFGAWQTWRYALLTVLIYEPHAVMLSGFYLSFIAVAILIIVSKRLAWKKIYQNIGLQMACVFGLMPLTLYWFSYGSLNGLIANLVAIPWVSFVIVPLGLIFMVLSLWIHIPILAAGLHIAISGLLMFLRWVDHAQGLNVVWTFTDMGMPILWMLLQSMLLLMPLPRMILMMVIGMLNHAQPMYDKISQGDARIHILDVGQGLAVVLKTQHHTLIYDTGAQFYQGSDMGKMVIVPYLNSQKIRRLDMVIISHPDLDHRGGLSSLEKAYPIDRLLVDNPDFYHKGFSCHQYPPWQWDGVRFRFFALPLSHGDKNNTSCVLQIKTRMTSFLLTGDIEKRAENYLVKHYRAELQSDGMLMPHHGSKTSSSWAMVDAVSPRYAVVSYGLDNRYHFPHAQALKPYQHAHIPIYDTAHCGMITLELSHELSSVDLQCYVSHT